jgi:hypothetical protein
VHCAEEHPAFRQQPLIIFFACLDGLLWGCCCLVSGIWRSGWLDQEQVRFFLCSGLMFNAMRNNKQFPWPKNHVTISQAHRQASFKNQKEVILLITTPTGCATRYSK